MSDVDNTVEQTGKDKSGRCGGGHHYHHHHHRRGHCLARVIGILAVFGIGFLSGKAMACDGFGWHGHAGPAAFMQDGHIDAERINKFADKRMQHMLDEVKASDEQKTKAGGIIKAAIEKGAPLAQKLHDNHEQMHKLMSAATLDKDAIEALRVEQLKLADEASKQMTSTMLAVAEILTPEQRAQLAKKMGKRHGWMHHE